MTRIYNWLGFHRAVVFLYEHKRDIKFHNVYFKVEQTVCFSNGSQHISFGIRAHWGKYTVIGSWPARQRCAGIEVFLQRFIERLLAWRASAFPPFAWRQLAVSAVTYINNIAITWNRSLSHQNIREIHSISSSLLPNKLPPKSFSCKSGLINNTNTLGGAMSCFCWKDKFFFLFLLLLFYFSSSSSSCNVSLLLFYSIFSRLNTQLSSYFISLPRPIQVVQSARSIQNKKRMERKKKNEFKTKQATDRKKIIWRRGK